MIRIEGLDLAQVVGNTVQQIRDSVDESTLRKVGFTGADIFRREVQQNALANKKTGTLYRNIIVVRLEEESDGARRQVYKVTIRDNPAFYWRFVEAGHKFVPRNKKVSKRTGKKIGWKAHRRAAELEYGTATVPAYPFVRPAYESMKEPAVDMMTRTLAEQIARNRRER